MSWCEKKYGKQYLTFTPLSSETAGADATKIMLRNDASTSLTGTFEAKLNDNDWTTISWEHVSHEIDYNLVQACDPEKETIHYGEKLQIRGIDKWNDSFNGYCKLKVISEGGAKVYGKLAESLTPEFAASMADGKLARFFSGSTGLKDASGLDLDGIVIATSCCYGMFQNCTSLVNAPKQLPATTLADGCYAYMFNNCTLLATASELLATTLAPYCYYCMFIDCTSLTATPALPATTLSLNCYDSMFGRCTSLAGRLDLPAAAPANDCYTNMLRSCGTANIKEVHMPKSLSGSFDESMFGSNTGVTVIYDL